MPLSSVSYRWVCVMCRYVYDTSQNEIHIKLKVSRPFLGQLCCFVLHTNTNLEAVYIFPRYFTIHRVRTFHEWWQSPSPQTSVVPYVVVTYFKK
jgi:F0F1-type ATP synthase membrane subunit a